MREHGVQMWFAEVTSDGQLQCILGRQARFHISKIAPLNCRFGIRADRTSSFKTTYPPSQNLAFLPHNLRIFAEFEWW